VVKVSGSATRDSSVSTLGMCQELVFEGTRDCRRKSQYIFTF
jgi:hypothetical protein